MRVRLGTCPVFAACVAFAYHARLPTGPNVAYPFGFRANLADTHT